MPKYELKIKKMKTGKFEVLLKREHTWGHCPGTSTYSNKTNATAGKNLFLAKQEALLFNSVKRRLMASPQFCKGVL